MEGTGIAPRASLAVSNRTVPDKVVNRIHPAKREQRGFSALPSRGALFRPSLAIRRALAPPRAGQKYEIGCALKAVNLTLRFFQCKESLENVG